MRGAPCEQFVFKSARTTKSAGGGSGSTRWLMEMHTTTKCETCTLGQQAELLGDPCGWRSPQRPTRKCEDRPSRSSACAAWTGRGSKWMEVRRQVSWSNSGGAIFALHNFLGSAFSCVGTKICLCNKETITGRSGESCPTVRTLICFPCRLSAAVNRRKRKAVTLRHHGVSR